jgi:ferric-dicitrate binding protein FerR (iron transport regulator)
MKNPGDEFNRKWREASQRVRFAEEKMHKAWAAFGRGEGPAPAQEMMEEVTRLRRECDAELSQLLANIQIQRKGGSEHPG